jgi:K+-sensing histidine kinase KdpD
MNDKALLLADENKLVQVFINILQNAAKFSPSESLIKVSTQETTEYFKISIKDQGKGIEKKDLPHVFKDFYKGESDVKEGMGLGLFLTKYIIDSHNGKIEIHSHKNTGTEVIVNLPKIYVRNATRAVSFGESRSVATPGKVAS